MVAVPISVTAAKLVRLLKQLKGDAGNLLPMLDDCGMRDADLSRRFAHAVAFQQQKQHPLLHVGETWNNLVDDVLRNDFALDSDRTRRLR